MPSPYALVPEDIAFPEEPRYRADQVRGWLYETPVLSTDAMTNLPGALRNQLEPLWPFSPEVEQRGDEGRTRKWLFRAPDGASIEAVLMGYPKRTTLCMSSQAGCAMACSFCATGQFGFERQLDAGEIVAQVAYANAALRDEPLPQSPDRVTNVVFMGMGEPMANYRHVRESIRRMIEVMGMSARSITVSTVGVVPGIHRLLAEPWSVNLAVSVHAADDELRSKLVPLNRRYDLEQITTACEEFFATTGRRVSLEWTLIAGVNDTPDQARSLAAMARRLRAHVNVIEVNPTPLSEDRPPEANRTRQFMATLGQEGANATLRDTRGRDIDGACGQLRTRRVDVVKIDIAGGSVTVDAAISD